MSELVKAILTIVEKLEVKTSEVFVEAVLKRLSSFGYSVTTDDGWQIAFCIQKVNQHIINSCNTLSIPDGLFYAAVDMVCGEFLFGMKETGKLELENIDLAGVITQIHEGDTTIQFANGSSDDEKFSAFVNYLRTWGESDLVCYRKLKW